MKHQRLVLAISLNLCAFIALCFAYPHLMVSPGALVLGHTDLQQDCFACHAPWRGASAARCVVCHVPGDIGLRTTKGKAIAARTARISFHQDLIEQDCVACHSDHAGPKLTQRSRKPFSHALLRPAVRDRCETCHAAPTDEIHRDLRIGCAQCHRPEGWKPAQFDHANLTSAVLDRCEACHRAPSDRLHANMRGNCKPCHTPAHWKPATFDHARFFVLDHDHETDCATCHPKNDYARYTCYGCHEHQPASIRAEHEEDGISNLANCVRCHRSADAEPEREGGGEGGRTREDD